MMPNTENFTDYTAPSAAIVGYNGALDMAAASARISTTEGSARTILEKSRDNPNNLTLVKRVLGSGHKSILEHAGFNLVFNNVSVFTEQFMIEFRLGSFTVQSRRYVDFRNAGYSVSPDWSPAFQAAFRRHTDALFASYGTLLELGIPKEDARFVLPYCFHSNFYCSCNARELAVIICTMVYGRGRYYPELYRLGLSLKEQYDAYLPGILDAEGKRYRASARFDPDAAPAPQLQPVSVGAGQAELLSCSAVSGDELSAWAEYNFSLPGTRAAWSDLLAGERPRELELAHLLFRLRDVSLAAITHITRHRMQSLLIPSVLTAVTGGRHVLPETVRANPEALEEYEAVFARTDAFTREHRQELPLCDLTYLALSGHTMDLLAGMNGREFLHFCNLRTCARAQWEIRDLAMQMLRLARAANPTLFASFGPSCFTQGVCPEGKMTCGRAVEMKALFSVL